MARLFVGTVFEPLAKDFQIGHFQLRFSIGHSYPVKAFGAIEVCELHFTTEIDTLINPSLTTGANPPVNDG